ncbi:MAG TPA: hypothetical protein VNO82_16370 [Solirubrobacteraceae bacterium]|nr:hypothetical protein [Solirubrobacteraceae bacterium]
MGLLDDAIREHLELKRQRGADLSEVERQEREALGATKQAEFASAEAEPAAEAGEPVAEATEPVDSGDEREPFDIEVAEPEPPAAEPEAVADEVAPPPEPELPAPGAEAAAPGYDEDPWLEEERDEVPAGESLDHPREAEPEEPAEDVLEDTPDFLQETPEHDRLWFEQRPPRDFDWDK